MTLEKISSRFIKYHPLDAVRLIEHLGDEEKAALVTSLAPDTAAKILQAMTPADVVTTIAKIAPPDCLSILKTVSPNFTASTLRRLPPDVRRSIMEHAQNEGELKNVSTLLHFPPGVVGAIMNPDAFVLQEQMTVKEAVTYVKRHPDKLQNVIYVVNMENVLTGLIEAKDLLVLKDNATINTSMKPVQYKLNGRTYLGAAVDNSGWEHVDSMPIVDYQGIYLGVLTRDSFLKALTETDLEETQGDQPKEILIGLAETFLNTCSELLFPQKK